MFIRPLLIPVIIYNLLNLKILDSGVWIESEIPVLVFGS